MTAIANRYDFVLFFDVQDGNPNGDPDAGNLPRIDPETGHGLVTDVCLKRKVRNFVLLEKAGVPGYDIYVKERAVLGRAHEEAFRQLGIGLGSETRTPLDQSMADKLAELQLPDGLGLNLDAEGGPPELVVAADADSKAIREALKESDFPKEVVTFIGKALKGAKSRKPTSEETDLGRGKMCGTFYDVRTFGAVMSLKSAPNCGQVRGPVQLTFSRSVDPIVQLEHSITRMAVATEAEALKQGGDNRTMGRKSTIPYGLYRCHGFVSAPLAKQTGFTQQDLETFWRAVEGIFEHDRSAARGLMNMRKLVIFKHESELGNAPASALFDLVTAARREPARPARTFADYDVRFPTADKLPTGVSVEVRPNV
jgi:CRISPR-associated protein Csd2